MRIRTPAGTLTNVEYRRVTSAGILRTHVAAAAPQFVAEPNLPSTCCLLQRLTTRREIDGGPGAQFVPYVRVALNSLALPGAQRVCQHARQTEVRAGPRSRLAPVAPREAVPSVRRSVWSTLSPLRSGDAVRRLPSGHGPYSGLLTRSRRSIAGSKRVTNSVFKCAQRPG